MPPSAPATVESTATRDASRSPVWMRRAWYRLSSTARAGPEMLSSGCTARISSRCAWSPSSARSTSSTNAVAFCIAAAAYARIVGSPDGISRTSA
eukprot:3676340-Prymnesium_polylepis.3